ncbi:putative nucleic acid-binding protein [Sphingomonas sp. BE138]|uniref:type II toxin-antitoxin system VapC family toxin n=1 Tax=Sphingomonas sp. BE138 TaxID=2817845 RepID=UPI00285F3A74|nr:type II toxin-antitoxin system VapC family toxin [Sphingomonas sp. BE138]MDR6787231.1 putative nucleic acid-binding protein [Sphingomonas sp. BE138]
MIFVDSHVVIDLVEDGEWTNWSKQALGNAARPLVANHVVVAEVARAFRSSDAVMVFLTELGIAIEALTPAIAYRAGHAHVGYRLAGGRQQSVLADFLIGAHAVSLGATLVTRDRKRFATYFPDLTLITPETDHG